MTWGEVVLGRSDSWGEVVLGRNCMGRSGVGRSGFGAKCLGTAAAGTWRCYHSTTCSSRVLIDYGSNIDMIWSDMHSYELSLSI